MKQIMKILVQVMAIWSLAILGNEICAYLHLSMIPGSIVGLLILLMLLQFKIIKVEWLSAGGDWLISNLLLFFAPAFLGIIQYEHMMRLDGLRLVCLIAISTTLVMLSTGLLGEYIHKWKVRRKHDDICH